MPPRAGPFALPSKRPTKQTTHALHTCKKKLQSNPPTSTSTFPSHARTIAGSAILPAACRAQSGPAGPRLALGRPVQAACSRWCHPGSSLLGHGHGAQLWHRPYATKQPAGKKTKTNIKLQELQEQERLETRQQRQQSRKAQAEFGDDAADDSSSRLLSQANQLLNALEAELQGVKMVPSGRRDSRPDIHHGQQLVSSAAAAPAKQTKTGSNITGSSAASKDSGSKAAQAGGRGGQEAGGEEKTDEAEKFDPLPNAFTYWETEFKPLDRSRKIRQYLEASLRIYNISRQSLFRPKDVFFLATSLGCVYAIGLAEAFVLLQGATWDHLPYALVYAYENMLCSLVWETKPLDLVVQSMGVEPSSLGLGTDTKGMAEAKRLLQAQSLASWRCIIAGYMMIAQIFRMVNISLQSAIIYRKRIATGTVSLQSAIIYRKRIATGHEPPLRGPTERIIRLCGKESDVTRLSLDRYGQYIVPIFEEPEHLQYLIRRHSGPSGLVPVLWNVGEQQYGAWDSWKKLFSPPPSAWGLRTEQDERVLYIEADATNPEEALWLASQSADLTVQEASHAFRMIEMVTRYQWARTQDGLARASWLGRAWHRLGVKLASEDENAAPDRVMRVFLADALQSVRTGGGHTFTLRDHLAQSKEADVLIDSTTPILKEVLEWCQEVQAQEEAEKLLQSEKKEEAATEAAAAAAGSSKPAPKQPRKKIVFDTSSPTYFTVIKELLHGHGYEVLDRGDTGWAEYSIPRLIYHSTTTQTISTLHALLQNNLADPGRCCVIIDSEDGLKEIAYIRHRFQRVLVPQERPATSSSPSFSVDIPTAHQGELRVVCSAVIYDDLFRLVRNWTRMGISPQRIQHQLDLAREQVN
eukprot:g12246.t1